MNKWAHIENIVNVLAATFLCWEVSGAGILLLLLMNYPRYKRTN